MSFVMKHFEDVVADHERFVIAEISPAENGEIEITALKSAETSGDAQFYASTLRRDPRFTFGNSQLVIIEYL